MAFPTWTPLAVPQLGTGFNHDESILEAKFGENYKQTLADGPNAQFVEGTLVWNGLTEAQYADLMATWAAQGKSNPMWYTLPGDLVPILIVYKSPFAKAQISRDPSGERVYSTSVSIEQRFDLG